MMERTLLLVDDEENIADRLPETLCDRFKTGRDRIEACTPDQGELDAAANSMLAA